MIVLGRAEVSGLLDPDALIEAVATALGDLSAGRASVPPRIAAFTPAGLLGAMVAWVPSLDLLAAKLVSVFPQNVGTPTHQAVVAVFDGEQVHRALIGKTGKTDDEDRIELLMALVGALRG